MSNVDYLIYERRVRDMLIVVGSLEEQTRAMVRRYYDLGYDEALCADQIKLDWMEQLRDDGIAGSAGGGQ